MSRPTVRSARAVGIAAIVAGVAASSALIWQASYSAFTSTTSNPTSNWSSGTVALSDDDTNTALFTVTGLKPGATGSRCIAVTSDGSLASAVKLYGTNASTTNGLSSSISLAVTQGTGGSFGSCAGFAALASSPNLYSGSLAGFASASTDFATGLGNWAPTGTGAETRTFQITYTLDANTPNTAQGGTAAIGFTWESQNS